MTPDEARSAIAWMLEQPEREMSFRIPIPVEVADTLSEDDLSDLRAIISRRFTEAAMSSLLAMEDEQVSPI